MRVIISGSANTVESVSLWLDNGWAELLDDTALLDG